MGIIDTPKGRTTARQVGKRSPRGALLRTLTVYNRDDSLYLWRLRLLDTPWFGVYLHHLASIDQDWAMHDHPWSFVSFVLWGWYVEQVPNVVGGLAYRKYRFIDWFNRKRAEDRHRVSQLSDVPVWTLVLRGPRRRRWGFHTEQGWVDADQYEGAA